MSCHKAIAVVLIIFVNQWISTEAQLFHQSELDRPTAFHRQLQSASYIKNADDFRGNFLKTVTTIQTHPFAKALHGLDHQERTAAIHQLNQMVASLNGSVSNSCFEDLSFFLLAIEVVGKTLMNGSFAIDKNAEFAIRQLDAFGKIPSGILDLNTMFFGSYEECLRIDVPNGQMKRQYQGKFCTAYIPIQNNGVCPRDIIDPNVQPGDAINWHWCLPNSCGNDDLPQLAHADPASKALLAFSIYSNGVAIMDMTQKSGQIHCINCIRVFSIVWVMLGHSYEFVPYVNNLIAMQDLPHQLDTLTITNAYFSVDSFFFLSGLLLGFLFFKEISKHPNLFKKPSTWIMFYVHRYLRLTPSYAFVLAAYAIMLPYWTGGIWWRQNDFLSKGCYDSWWTNMLYINNYAMQDKQCMGTGWYLAADMQMHIAAPIVLIALWKSQYVGFAISAALIFLSTVANFYTTVHYHLRIHILGSPGDSKEVQGIYGIYMYNAAWIRFIPYLQGLLLGLILFKNGSKRVKIPWLINMSGWIICLSLMPTLVYGPHYTTQGHLLDLWVRASYNAFSRPAWGLCLCWIVFSCYYDYGGEHHFVHQGIILCIRGKDSGSGSDMSEKLWDYILHV
uniref:Nose resistant-to-fluoxetine protein N-terminal domain-containing protein n=1 Tax=Plectus sambesii TaxID=2011161 RepID=A0A914UHU8_9BILA